MIPIFVAVLALGLLAGGAAPDIDNQPLVIPEDVEHRMEEVLNEPERVLTSVENVTTATQLLAALPDPEARIPVAIYRLTDKTGQNKADGGAQSTVVTQGATEMLITALHRSRQFAVLDRINFQDIMNEQNLVTSDRTAPGQGPEIGVLTGANYAISGAITEYQVDKQSGGFGLRIAGRGGSQEYAVASAAIDVRVTNNSTGEVVWSQSFKQEVVGERVGISVFSFFGRNIVEFETGRGRQEVINIVVRTLLEEAVFDLIRSGVLEP